MKFLMKFFLMKFAVGCVATGAFAIAFAGPPTANPEPMDLDPDLKAKIMKEQSKRNPLLSGKEGGSGAECGTVNINSNEKKSNSGIGNIMGKQSTTIVMGPVINTANCK